MQLTLEQALSTLLRTPIAIVGCGRTDTGVHASDFYAHFDVKTGEEDIECSADKMSEILEKDLEALGGEGYNMILH